MPRTYILAGPEVRDVLLSLIRRHYFWMDGDRVTFCLLAAYGPVNKADARTAPAIVLHGHRAAATVRIHKLKERVQGSEDATIEIDGDEWPT